MPDETRQQQAATLTAASMPASELDAVHDALRKTDGSVRRLLDAIPQIIWTNDADGNTNYFNRRWYEYTGLDSKRSAALIWQALIHPDDAPVSNKRWQRAVKTGEVFECEYRLRNAAGEIVATSRCTQVVLPAAGRAGRYEKYAEDGAPPDDARG